MLMPFCKNGRGHAILQQRIYYFVLSDVIREQSCNIRDIVVSFNTPSPHVDFELTSIFSLLSRLWTCRVLHSSCLKRVFREPFYAFVFASVTFEYLWWCASSRYLENQHPSGWRLPCSATCTTQYHLQIHKASSFNLCAASLVMSTKSYSNRWLPSFTPYVGAIAFDTRPRSTNKDSLTPKTGSEPSYGSPRRNRALSHYD